MPERGEVLAERLNAEPAISKGCSSSELGVIVAVAALLWLPVSLVLAGLAGAVTMGFGIAGVGVVATVVAIASLFQRLKRNRPDAYYQQRVLLRLHDRGIRRSPFVRRAGVRDISRTGDGLVPPENSIGDVCTVTGTSLLAISDGCERVGEGGTPPVPAHLAVLAAQGQWQRRSEAKGGRRAERP